MIRAVVDTNVIVAGFLLPSGAPGRIVDWLRGGTVAAVYDDRIFEEYAEVLVRPVFRLPVADVELVLAVIRSRGERVDVGPQDTLSLPDPDDSPFAECARAASVPLVTGNLRHVPKRICRDIRVLTPAQFVALAARPE